MALPAVSMKSFIGYIGGKSRQAREIAARLPRSRCYCEVFGGAAWVLFARDPAPVEVWNDYDGRLVNLFRVVRDRPDELAAALACMPRSRELYYRLWREPPDRDPVRAAAAYYYLVKNAFSGRAGCGFSASRTWPGRYAMCNDFGAWAARLNRVTVEGLDFADCLGRYDGRDTVFYLDPPYAGTEGYYRGFAAEDHERLAKALRRTRGRWLLSYKDGAATRRLYHGFRVARLAAPYSAAKVKEGGRRAPAGREILISNY